MKKLRNILVGAFYTLALYILSVFGVMILTVLIRLYWEAIKLTWW